MKLPLLSFVLLTFLTFTRTVHSVRECFKEERATVALITLNKECKESCNTLQGTCPGYDCICFLETGDKCLIVAQQTQRKLLLTCGVFEQFPRGHFEDVKDVKEDKDASQEEIEVDLEADLSKVVLNENARSDGSITAVEKGTKHETFDFFGEVANIETIKDSFESFPPFA